MNIKIETEAFKTFFLGILSCKCPVTPETEKKLFDFYSGAAHQNTLDFNGILAIADKNPKPTPVHHLYDFCAGSKDDPFCFTITANEVLRDLGSRLHYNMVVSNHPEIESENPGLLISHLLLPVTIEKKGNQCEAMYANQEVLVRFSPVIMPIKSKLDSNEYAHHMGMILCGMSREQAEMLKAHQRLIKGLKEIAKASGNIDLRALPPYGDHLSQVVKRVSRYDI
ncbi:MAG: hypothetical protein HUK40_06265 [Desulfobacter sp.]|nr:hypothetical protein [Desulfobacter sp.]WDP84918.1 MAG: hypothetical protein HUN05_06920 [Desulfobacter sp.]